jgi:tetratricopeptide (TPR) repeat protein
MRSPRHRRHWPRVVPWSLGLLAGCAALLTVGYVVGRQHSSTSTKGLVFDSELATLARPGVAVLVAFAALTFIAWCFRRLWLEWLSWSPGPIEVPEFEQGTELNHADPARLTAVFRQRLAAFHCQWRSAPVPGAAPQDDFLDVLSQNGVDEKNLFRSMLALLRAAKPPHAYQVRGVLRERKNGRARFGVSVQVLRVPGEATPMQTFWGATWDDALARAGDHVTASVLPRTRLCRTPWTAWRRYVVPSELVHAYEEAASLQAQRRYDEALDSYYEALKYDPMNLALRRQVGFLQEELGLFLDALSTYEGIVTVACPDGRRLPRRLYRRRARRERRNELLIARYRKAVLLGGDDLARQWSHLGPQSPSGPDLDRWTPRDWQRSQLRTRLRPSLTACHERLRKDEKVRRELGVTVGAGRPLAFPKEPDEPPAAAPEHLPDRLQAVFRNLALVALHDLQRDLRRWGREPVTSAGIRLACVWTRRRQQLAKPRRKITADDLAREIAENQPRLGLRHWQDHYNAACIYALPLRSVVSPLSPDERKDLAQAAIGHLERATTCADSAYIAGRRDWLVSGDPDLEGLRSHELFKSFEAMYFPSARRTPRRPRKPHKWEASRYVVELLKTAAECRKEMWHARKGEEPDLDTLLDWWHGEARAWDLVSNVARNDRYWRARLDLIEATRDWAVDHGLETDPVPFPRYSDDPLGEAEEEEGMDSAAQARVKGRGERLLALAGIVETAQFGQSWHVGSQQRNGSDTTIASRQLTQLCEGEVALWRRLRGWLTADPSALDGEEAEFDTAMRATVELWRFRGRPPTAADPLEHLAATSQGPRRD